MAQQNAQSNPISEIFLAVFVIILILILLIEMPNWVINFSISLNITLGIVLLMISLYVQKPLELAAFPSIILIGTMFRLVLSIASTRLILAKGDAGEVVPVIVADVQILDGLAVAPHAGLGDHGEAASGDALLAGGGLDDGVCQLMGVAAGLRGRGGGARPPEALARPAHREVLRDALRPRRRAGDGDLAPALGQAIPAAPEQVVAQGGDKGLPRAPLAAHLGHRERLAQDARDVHVDDRPGRVGHARGDCQQNAEELLHGDA